MKNYITLFIVTTNVFCFSCFAQNSDSIPTNSKIENKEVLPHTKVDPVIISYHVEERINMRFGSSITTYNVPSLSLISANDLGPNNTRVVTPKYGNAKVATVEILNTQQPNFPVNINIATIKPPKEYVSPPKEKENYVHIDVLGTYETLLNKGYKSVDMLKRVSNKNYFEGNMEMAAKWYGQLFELTTDIETECYYRYAMALISTHQDEKGKEMMKQFEEKRMQK